MKEKWTVKGLKGLEWGKISAEINKIKGANAEPATECKSGTVETAIIVTIISLANGVAVTSLSMLLFRLISYLEKRKRKVEFKVKNEIISSGDSLETIVKKIETAYK